MTYLAVQSNTVTDVSVQRSVLYDLMIRHSELFLKQESMSVRYDTKAALFSQFKYNLEPVFTHNYSSLAAPTTSIYKCFLPALTSSMTFFQEKIKRNNRQHGAGLDFTPENKASENWSVVIPKRATDIVVDKVVISQYLFIEHLISS